MDKVVFRLDHFEKRLLRTYDFSIMYAVLRIPSIAKVASVDSRTATIEFTMRGGE